jgi:hypothetical protein
MPVIRFEGDTRIVLDATPDDPDAISDEDVLVLRRVLINVMRGPLGLSNAQVRAAFAAAKRQVD